MAYRSLHYNIFQAYTKMLSWGNDCVASKLFPFLEINTQNGKCKLRECQMQVNFPTMKAIPLVKELNIGNDKQTSKRTP